MQPAPAPPPTRLGHTSFSAQLRRRFCSQHCERERERQIGRDRELLLQQRHFSYHCQGPTNICGFLLMAVVEHRLYGFSVWGIRKARPLDSVCVRVCVCVQLDMTALGTFKCSGAQTSLFELNERSLPLSLSFILPLLARPPPIGALFSGYKLVNLQPAGRAP